MDKIPAPAFGCKPAPLPHEPVSFKWQSWHAEIGGELNEDWTPATWCVYLRMMWKPGDKCQFTIANGQTIIVRAKP